MTTTTPVAQVQRPTADVCPPWCAGHLDAYQDWSQARDGSIRRYHYDHGVDLGEVSVTVGLEEILDRGLTQPVVEIVNNSGDPTSAPEFSDADAHELGLALVRAADTARRWRLSQEA